MRRIALSLFAVLALCRPALAGWVYSPDPPYTGYPPYGQSVDPDDSKRAAERLLLLQQLFPGATDYPKDVCHFSLYSTEQKPNPKYRAENLAFLCRNAPGDWTILRWDDGPQ